MNKNIEILAKTALFSGIAPEEIIVLLNCVNAKYSRFRKDDLIIEEGEDVREFGIMLSGHARSIKWDASDKIIIITLLNQGNEIGVLLAARPGHKSSVWVQAQDDVEVLQISYDRMISRCKENCPKHETMLRNYISIVADKGLDLHERINCLLKPTLREKIITYLLRESHEKQSRFFSIPMNRNVMAEYLNIERSALSRELSYMKRDGLIDYHKNSFKLTGLSDIQLSSFSQR